MALRTVGVRLVAEVSGYVGKLKQAETATHNFGQKIGKAADSGKLDNIADRAGVMGLGLAAGFGYAVKAAAEFDKQMSAVSAATSASAGDMKLLREAALQAGKDTSFSATEAAKGITELGKAGVATQDILHGGLKGALDLAAAGQLDVAEAAETAASAMTQFKLSGDKVPHIADLLAAAAGKAQGSVHDMGAALNQAGLVASQTGLSIEETTGGLAAFASAGLIGSDAGTSFKQMLLMLQSPSEKSAGVMEDLGISLYDSQGAFIGLSKFAGQLRTALKDLTPQARAAAMTQIFGADATRAASVMYEQGAEGVQKWIDKVNHAGYAQETAAKLTDNLAGDVDRLKGSLETMAIEAGSGANGGLRLLVQALGKLVDGFGSLPPFIGSTITVVGGLTAAALLLGAGWVKLRRTTTEMRAELEALGPGGERAARGMSRLAAAAGKTGVAFAALQLAGEVISSFQTDLAPKTDALAVGLENFAKGGEVAGESSRVLGADMDALKGKFRFLADEDNNRTMAVKNMQGALESLIPGLKGTDESLGRTKERIGAVDQALAAMVSSGNTQGASDAYNKLASVLAVNGVSMDEFKKQFPGYNAALEAAGSKAAETATQTAGLGKSLDEGKDPQEKYKTVAEATTAALKGQRDAFQVLSDAMKAETDPVFGLLDAQDKLTTAQEAASKAVKEHGKNSLEAKQATRELALAAISLQEKTGALSETFNGEMSPALVATLKAGGLTQAQIKDLGLQFVDATKKAEDYDGDYKANTSAPGAKGAKKDLDNAYTAANNFDGPYRAVLSTPGYGQAEKNIEDVWNKAKGYDGNWVANLKTQGYPKVEQDLRHLLAAQHALKQNISVNEANRELGRFFASGGPVYGPGTGTSDSIPARLSKGEHVWTAAEVAALGGQSAMLALRRAVKSGRRVEVGDETPGFADGGVVMPFPTDVSKTKIPTPKVSLPPGGGQTFKWMVAAVKAAFPGVGVLSTYRPGAVTLSGNRSYHSVGRAVDFSPSKPLAEWVNLHYKARTKELITPWNSLNIHNGSRHTYTGAIFRQHNFAGGNAHDHWAMRAGGTIREPIFGVGASGRTYSFGENYMPERVTPNWQSEGGRGGSTVVVQIVNEGVIGSKAEAESFLVGALDSLKRRGRI